jgi:hypothetical protein
MALQPKEPSKSLSPLFYMLYGAYASFTPNSAKASIENLLKKTLQTPKAIFLRIQNTFETGNLKLFPIKEILDCIFVLLPQNAQDYIEHFTKTKIGHDTAACSRIFDGVFKGDNSQNQVEELLIGLGVVSDELLVDLHKILWLETRQMPRIYMRPMQMIPNDPTSPFKISINIVNSAGTHLVVPMALPEYLLYVRDKVLKYKGVNLDYEIGVMLNNMAKTMQLNAPEANHNETNA